ncbi:g5341 [Coccomyxa viridis]|uniref:G5341 protein n=1 Tax=Coccomyxa viridis TaxID=1274662 RepID=A0ABP1FSK9_9CHLO
MRKMFGLVLALALHAAVLHSAQAASCDITDLGCIAKDFKASLKVDQGSFESEYQQFAEMIAPVLLLAHGGDFERADQALGDFFQSIVNTMAGLFQVATGQKQAQVSIAPPSFFNNGAANVSTSVAGVAGAAIGINYNPCVISVSPRGLDVTAAGINIQPNVIEVLGEGLAIWPWAINIQPALVYINPWGADISPQGINVTPALIAVAPVVHSFGKPAVAVNPVGLSVKPPPVPGTTVDGVPVKATPAASSSGSSSGSGSGASTGGGSGAGTGTTATVAGRKMV